MYSHKLTQIVTYTWIIINADTNIRPQRNQMIAITEDYNRCLEIPLHSL